MYNWTNRIKHEKISKYSDFQNIRLTVYLRGEKFNYDFRKNS